MTTTDTLDLAGLHARLAVLQDELGDLDEKRASIRGQIDKAKADRINTGEYADADWFRRANGALRHLGVERNDICREIGEVNRAIRKANGDANRHLFYLAVRDVVDDATWNRIVARHEHYRSDDASALSPTKERD